MPLRCPVSSLERLDFNAKLQSALLKKMAPRAAFWVDRHMNLFFTVLVWEAHGKELFLKRNSEQYMNSKVMILGKEYINQI